MKNINNSNEYDDYLKKYIKYYIVTIFKGRGRYTKYTFDTLQQAIQYRDLLKSINARAIIYGLSQPPHSNETISIAMGV
tara:strand:- start:2278 stop:2514 length:237 start_codon:yes stop_codon:yes gene_type:complete